MLVHDYPIPTSKTVRIRDVVVSLAPYLFFAGSSHLELLDRLESLQPATVRAPGVSLGRIASRASPDRAGSSFRMSLASRKEQLDVEGMHEGEMTLE